MGYPKMDGVYITENLIKMNDLGMPPSRKPPHGSEITIEYDCIAISSWDSSIWDLNISDFRWQKNML